MLEDACRCLGGAATDHNRISWLASLPLEWRVARRGYQCCEEHGGSTIMGKRPPPPLGTFIVRELCFVRGRTEGDAVDSVVGLLVHGALP